MLKALRQGISDGKIVPVLVACATRTMGIAPLLDLIVNEFPSPADRGEVSGLDPKTKQLATRRRTPRPRCRRWSSRRSPIPTSGSCRSSGSGAGTLRSESTLLNPGRGGRERVSHVSWLMGKTVKNVEALGPGEIGVVAKLKETKTGDTLCDEAQPIELPRITFPESAISFAIQPKARGAEDKISNALARIAEEDPTVHYHYNPETKQLLVSGSVTSTSRWSSSG
jgi:elongation factor G